MELCPKKETVNQKIVFLVSRGKSRTAATSKMEYFVIIVNYYHKVLHHGCCSSRRSASG